MGLTMNEKKSVTRETAVRYRHAGKAVKRVIINEFVALTGYHRKYAVKVFNAAAKTCLAEVYGRTVIRKAERKKRLKREYAKCYDEPVQVMPGRVRDGFAGAGSFSPPFRT
jgi:hypothetical protein